MSGQDNGFMQRSKDEIVEGGQTGVLKDIGKGGQGGSDKSVDGLNEPGNVKEDVKNAIPQTGKPQ